MATSDARLWATMLEPLDALGMDVASRDRLGRVLVAIVRRERDPETRTWGPGESIPRDVAAVYDLDGDRWERRSSPGAETWRMPGFDPGDHAAALGGWHVTESLLLSYGPVTEVKES